jgi:hypothetical protein
MSLGWTILFEFDYELEFILFSFATLFIEKRIEVLPHRCTVI